MIANVNVLTQILDISEVDIITPKNDIISIPAELMLEGNTEQQKTKDIHDVRSNLLNIIETTSDILEDAVVNAKQSGDAKQYDALSKLMNSLVNANESLLRLHKQRGEMALDNKKLLEKPEDKKKNEDSNTNITVEKAVFVGSPTELLKIIKNHTKND